MASSPTPSASAPSSSSSTESSESFEQRIQSTVSSGFLIPCIAIGSKLGLFDKMAEFTEPKTSMELADAMDYKERYVREWLSSMVCMRVIDYDACAKTYFFPETRHALFTKKGGKKNIATLTQGLVLAVAVYPELQECFKKDGPLGIPYENYVGFHEWREMRTAIQFSEEYLRSIFVQEPGLLEKLEAGMSVCDMGCSTGNQARLLATMFPRSTVHGCDIGPDAIRRAEAINAEQQLPNLSFSVQDVCELRGDWSEAFDLVVVFDVIHDLAHASRALGQIRASLKGGGLFYMMDIESKSNPVENSGVLYTMSLFHCMAQSLYHEGSEGLGTAWGGVKAREMLTAAGFSAIRDLKGPEPLYMHIVCDK